MTLHDFLATLTTPNAQVTLLDLDSGAEIVSMKASGYEHLDDALENREVRQWAIASATSVKITLAPVATTE